MKEVICWIIGGIFFLVAFNIANLIGADSTLLQADEIGDLALVIIYGFIGLAFAISGSIFHSTGSEH
jgi:hypothetical protein